MKKIIFLTVVLSFPMLLMAQDFNRKYFVNTAWFSENKDSLFYKADTLKFILYKNPAPEWYPEGKAENERKYLGHGEYVKLELKKNNFFEVSNIWYHMASILPENTYKWKFDTVNKRIDVFKGRQLVFSYKPIKTEEVKVESKFSEQKGTLSTTMMTAVRVK